MSALGKLKGEFVIDGEICLLDDRGLPNFEGMRARTVRKGGELVNYFAFDLLFLHGKALRALPLSSARSDSPSYYRRIERIAFVDHIETERDLVFRHALRSSMHMRAKLKTQRALLARQRLLEAKVAS